MIKIGHRGACGYAPENTLASFKKALELKVDAVELDVCALADDTLVVIHDEKVNRTTNGIGYVINKTLKEIKQLDAGNGEKIPTLQEVLDLLNRQVIVNLDLKGENTAGLVATVINNYVENKYWKNSDFIVSSLNHYELQRFSQILPQVKIGAIVAGIPLNYAEFGEELKAYSIHVDLEFINKPFVEDAHRRGLKVFVYTVNDKDDIERMKSLNVDGLFSDYPDRIA